ncbi:hypothetical protein [Haliangium ochraceum]|uniref:hypothetical protein n=1 Tax=Haliangium ochraceum TaxID=80816 RepID=UPI00019BAA2D|nr:hypothetical protein [Haliangium ochraceum]
MPSAAIGDWLARAAHASALLYDRFPVRRVSLLVVLASGRGVRAASTAQGGGASVLLHLGTATDEAALRANDIAVHELLHLGLPVVADSARWLSEG